ncbi:MAG: 4-hydroxy-tetrahydrodipicolinate synthase [Actinomycetota bacterium]|nr:4-hydroxy-tetrahydrodipicolinate synthase [Actinomycetota bacterium]
MAGGRFGTVACAMVTPFDAEGAVDLDGAVHLARWLVAHGNDGLIVTGTTGESPTLSDEEKIDLWRAVTEAVTVPVVAGAGTADTAHSARLAKAAAGVGVSGILAVTPYYNRPSQAGIETHIRAMASASGLPVMLYDIPLRTGRKVNADTIVALAADGVICGVKDATALPALSAAVIAAAPRGFELYSGNDADTLPLLAVGAVGVISVESHWAGEEVAEMVAAFAKGDNDHARVLNARLLESHRFQSSDAAPNPVPTKAMLSGMGLPGGECRAPMGPPPPGLGDEAAAILSRLRLPR